MNRNSPSNIHPDAVQVFMQVMKNRPESQKNRALELALAIGIPPDDPSFLFAAACGYLESLLEVGPKEWEKILLWQAPERFRTLLLTEAPEQWSAAFDKFTDKIEVYQRLLNGHESRILEAVQDAESLAIREVQEAIAKTAQTLLERARNSITQEEAQERKKQDQRRFYTCLSVCLTTLAGIFSLGVYVGIGYINTKFQEPRNVFARNLYYWNVDRLAKCQKDNNPKCTLRITSPDQQ